MDRECGAHVWTTCVEHMKGSLGIACSGTDSSGLQAGEATEGPRVKGGAELWHGMNVQGADEASG